MVIFSSEITTQVQTRDVGRFDVSQSVAAVPWKIIRLDWRVPATQYRVLLWDGVAAVETIANASMALLARPLTINLKLTPILCWRWRVETPLNTADMATKAGDDYAARVYVAFSLPSDVMALTTRFKLELARKIYGDHVPETALNYVWDNRYPIGSKRFNAYTDRTQMIVLQSGAQRVGSWLWKSATY